MKKKIMGKALATAVMLTVFGGANIFGMSGVAEAMDLIGSQSEPLDLSQYTDTELSTYKDIYLIKDTSNPIKSKELKIAGKNFEITGELIGAASGGATNNYLTIENSKIKADDGICAVKNYDSASASGNILLVKGGEVEAWLYASYATSYSDAESNGLIIDGAKIKGNVYGAKGTVVSNNYVTIKNGADLEEANVLVVDGTTNGGNTLNFENFNGTVKSISNLDAITLLNSSGITVTGDLDLSNAYNGEATVDITLDKDLADMTVGVKKSIVKAASIIEATTTNYTLNGVTVTNGAVQKFVTKTDNGVDVSNLTFNANTTEIAVTANSKLLTGKFIDGSNPTVEKELVLDAKAANYANIYGAYSENAAASELKATVEMKDSVDLSKSTIWGNNKGAAGNTLKVSAVDVKVGNIKNFENLSFVLPADINSGDKMLTVNSALDMKDVKGVDVDGSKATNIHKGGTVDLLTANSISNYNAEVTMDGALVEKKATVAQEDNVLRLTVVEEKPKENENGVKISKAPVEAVAAGVAAINEGADLIAGGMMSSLAVADANSSADVFGAIGGSKGKYKTGSHVESNSWNIGLGLGKVNAKEKNTSTAGLFFEYGKSDFDTYNGNLKGDGKAFYRGAGILGRVDNHSGNYIEGSIRAGRASTEWGNSDAGSYDDSATYYGLHAGYGHKFQVGKAQKLDLYGKYFFSHVGSMEGKLKEADYEFDSVNTHRARVGARLEYDLKGGAKPYFGLAYEHTFNGDANAKMRFGNDSANPGAPSLKGNTGIMEAGCTWTGNKFDLSAGVEGYTGVRKGISGSVKFNLKF